MARTIPAWPAAFPHSAHGPHHAVEIVGCGIHFLRPASRRLMLDLDDVPAGWRAAAIASTYSLWMTPAELQGRGERLDDLIRPYIGLTREDAPSDNNVVHLQLDAFLHPDAPR